jgi:Ran-binding protein 3
MLRPSSFGTSVTVETSNNTNESSEKENASGGVAGGGCAEEETAPTFNPFKNVNQSIEENAVADKEKAIEPGEVSPRSDSAEKKPDPLTPLTQLANGMPKSSLFTNVTSTISENSGFVFGQNVHERVIVENKQPATAEPATGADNLFSASGTSSGGASLFASSSDASTEQKTSENGEASKTDSQSLVEAARKYEESRGAQKRKYEEVETVTGEEDERNILEINCKLFAFLASNYEERGRGTLRLNDSKKPGGASRVVFRTSGVLRVLMNTKIWAGMIAEPASQKSLRLTAIDNDGHIKVFLVMVSTS